MYQTLNHLPPWHFNFCLPNYLITAVRWMGTHTPIKGTTCLRLYFGMQLRRSCLKTLAQQSCQRSSTLATPLHSAVQGAYSSQPPQFPSWSWHGLDNLQPDSVQLHVWTSSFSSCRTFPYHLQHQIWLRLRAGPKQHINPFNPSPPQPFSFLPEE